MAINCSGHQNLHITQIKPHTIDVIHVHVHVYVHVLHVRMVYEHSKNQMFIIQCLMIVCKSLSRFLSTTCTCIIEDRRMREKGGVCMYICTVCRIVCII